MMEPGIFPGFFFAQIGGLKLIFEL